MKRCLLIVLFCSVICTVNAASDKPNVIMIYADDLGKGMLSAYGQKHFTTPNIDALINGGVSFSRAYGSSMTPKARAALLTGYHDCNHLKWRISRGGAYSMDDMKLLDVNESFLNDNDIPLEANDPYLPQVFKDAGYLTAQIGMLGWGNTTTRKQMTMHGWSYYYGYLDHFRSQGYYPTFLFENGEMAKIEGNTRSDCGKGRTPENEQTYKERWNMEGKHAYAPDSMLTKTLEFIRYFKDTPFFVLFSTQLPHGPVSIPSVHPEVANNDALTPIEKEYASMVKLLDDQVGVIMAELRALGIEDNTIVIFTSDNGHEISYQQQGRFEPPFSDVSTGERFDDSYFKYYGYKAGDVFNGNANLAGLKQSNLEGGIRVP
ncbi:MAG: sulfatase-like hydrolase/transferase, partial [Tannerella sp.]|nr:sulfatase-like hydrolase/transferase [Tannerella sp.]